MQHLFRRGRLVGAVDQAAVKGQHRQLGGAVGVRPRGVAALKLLEACHPAAQTVAEIPIGQQLGLGGVRRLVYGGVEEVALAHSGVLEPDDEVETLSGDVAAVVILRGSVKGIGVIHRLSVGLLAGRDLRGHPRLRPRAGHHPEHQIKIVLGDALRQGKGVGVILARRYRHRYLELTVAAVLGLIDVQHLFGGAAVQQRLIQIRHRYRNIGAVGILRAGQGRGLHKPALQPAFEAAVLQQLRLGAVICRIGGGTHQIALAGGLEPDDEKDGIGHGVAVIVLGGDRQAVGIVIQLSVFLPADLRDGGIDPHLDTAGAVRPTHHLKAAVHGGTG